MKINHFKNILILSFILLSIFLLSYDDIFNQMMTKNYMDYFILLVIIYCIFAELPLIIILLILLLFIFNNDDFYDKYIQKNKYLKNYVPLRKKKVEHYENNQDDNETLNNYEINPYNANPTINKEVIHEKNNKKDDNEIIKLDDSILKNNEENNEENKEENIEENIKLEIKKEIKEPFKNDVEQLRNNFNQLISQI